MTEQERKDSESLLRYNKKMRNEYWAKVRYYKERIEFAEKQASDNDREIELLTRKIKRDEEHNPL